MSGAHARGGFEAVLDQRLRVLSMIEQLDKPSSRRCSGTASVAASNFHSHATFASPQPRMRASGCPSWTSGPSPHGVAVELAEELAAQPPIAVAGVLRAVVGAEHLPLEDALRIERDAVRRCSSSTDRSKA